MYSGSYSVCVYIMCLCLLFHRKYLDKPYGNNVPNILNRAMSPSLCKSWMRFVSWDTVWCSENKRIVIELANQLPQLTGWMCKGMQYMALLIIVKHLLSTGILRASTNLCHWVVVNDRLPLGPYTLDVKGMILVQDFFDALYDTSH